MLIQLWGLCTCGWSFVTDVSAKSNVGTIKYIFLRYTGPITPNYTAWCPTILQYWFLPLWEPKYRTQLKNPSLPIQCPPVNTILTQFHFQSQQFTSLISILILSPNFISISVRFTTKPPAAYPVLHFTTPFFSCFRGQLNWTKLRGLSPRANYTDRAAAAGRRS